MPLKILGIAGSLRAGSINRALLRASGELFGAHDATLTPYEIGDLPLYNGDLDDEAKAPARALVEAITAADGLLVVTPEYNYSIPGALKNALDWASRPAYRSCLAHKPTAIMSASIGPIGGARAQSHLRQVLGGTVTPLFPHPDLAVGNAPSKFDNAGALTDDKTRQSLERFVAQYVAWLRATAGAAEAVANAWQRPT